MRYWEDADLALRLSLLGPFAFIRKPLTVYHTGSAGSLAVEALKKKTVLKQNVVKVRERMDEAVRANGDYAQLRAPIRRALCKARRELWVARFGQKRMLGAPTVSRLFERAEHYCGAIARRLPWYPKMKTVLVPNGAACSSKSCMDLGRQDILR